MFLEVLQFCVFCAELICLGEGVVLGFIQPSHSLKLTSPTMVGCVCGGGGAVLDDEVVQGHGGRRSLILMLTSTRPVFRALQSFQQRLQAGVLLAQTDNTTVLSYLNLVRGTRSCSLNRLDHSSTHWCMD